MIVWQSQPYLLIEAVGSFVFQIFATAYQETVRNNNLVKLRTAFSQITTQILFFLDKWSATAP